VGATVAAEAEGFAVRVLLGALVNPVTVGTRVTGALEGFAVGEEGEMYEGEAGFAGLTGLAGFKGLRGEAKELGDT
jgi:hypothetical protein